MIFSPSLYVFTCSRDRVSGRGKEQDRVCGTRVIGIDAEVEVEMDIKITMWAWMQAIC